MATKNAKSATSEKASVKPAKDTAVKAADFKPAVKDVTAKAVPAKEAPEMKAEEKPAVKTETAPKKEAASKETTAKKETAKKAATKKKEITTTVRIQYLGKDVAVKDKIKEIRAIWQKAGNRVRDIKDIELYVKPEDNKIYFVVNGDFDGSVDM